MKKVLMVLTCLFVASSAWAGTAYYGGFAAETGVPVFDGVTAPTTMADVNSPEAAPDQPVCTGFNTLLTTSGVNGTPKINFTTRVAGGGFERVNVNVGRVKGGFTQDGTPSRTNYVTIANGTDYTYEARWDVPANPMSASWSSTALSTNARMFIGADFDGGPQKLGTGAGQMGVAGIEWHVGQGKWLLSSDEQNGIGGNTPLATAPTHFAIKGVKQYVGGFPLFRAEYSVDEGTTWSSMPFGAFTGYGVTTVYDSVEWINLSHPTFVGLIGDVDINADYLAWSVRGAAATNLSFIVVGGAGVPNVNATLDADSDGIPNYADPTYDIPAGFGDLDGDGLRDGLEAFWGTSESDPDTDGDGILDGIEAALYPTLNPTVFNSATLPVAGGLGLGLLGLGLAVVGARRIRK